MKPAIIYTILGIQAVVFSAFIWVIDGRAESRSNTQRAENIIKIAEVQTSVNSLSYRMETMEKKLEDVAVVWTLQDVVDVMLPYFADQKTFIKTQDKKLLAAQKKKYETFYLEGPDGKLYKIYAIETKEDEWLTLRMIEVDDYEDKTVNK